MRTQSAGLLALAGVAFLILTAMPGTARAGEADAAVMDASERSTTPASAFEDTGTPAPLVTPAPPVNPVPIQPIPWPIEMPALQPGTAWPTFGPLRMQTVDVTPQEILPEPSADGSTLDKKGGYEILPVYEIA